MLPYSQQLADVFAQIVVVACLQNKSSVLGLCLSLFGVVEFGT